MSRASIQFSDRGSDYEPEEAQIYEDESLISSVVSIGAGDRYSLLPLDRKRCETRLIQLLPSSDESSPIECKLYVVSRNDGPIYTALSYAWGNKAHVSPIKVNGLDWWVTENLHSALTHIREAENAVTLWVDAICIDQKNDEEKSWHVQQMRETFTEASDVIAWLGPATESEIDAMKMLGKIGEIASTIAPDTDLWSDATHDRILELYREAQITKEDPDEIDPLKKLFRDIVDREGLHFSEPGTSHIFGRIWWKRTWVVQEMSVPSNIRFLCGHSSASFHGMIAAAVLYYQYNTSVWSFHREDSDKPKVQKRIIDLVYLEDREVSFDADCIYAQCTTRWAYRNWAKSPSGLPLAFIVSSVFAYGVTRVLEASDARDYVFALLGLATDAQKLDLAADYTKSPADVFKSFSRALIQHGHFIALSWCRTQAPRRLRNLPSWAPDLSQRAKRPFQWVARDNKTNQFSLEPAFSAGTRLPAHDVHSLEPASAFHLTANTLHLHGTLFDTVSHTAASFDELHSRNLPDAQIVTRTCIRFLRELKAALEHAPVQSVYPTAAAKASAVWRTATVDVAMSPSWEKKRWGTPLSPLHQQMYDRNFPYEDMLEHATDFQSLFDVVDMANLQRRPFVTAKGYLGLGPEEIRPGDTVMVFAGAQMPIVCRDGIAGSVVVVGDSYLHGIMDGEIMDMKPDVRGVFVH